MGSSDTSSQITVDSYEIADAGSSSSFLDYAEFGARSTEWTNEKHCLYLKSMEASFINELHCSMGLYRGREKKRKVSEKYLFQQHTSFRDGVWKSICVNGYCSKSEAPAVMTNRWIKHIRKHQEVEGAISDQEIESKKKADVLSDKKPRQSTTTLSRKDSADSNIEISDQNFVDSNESMKSCRVNRPKRSRKTTEADNNADSDQVVPKDPTVKSDP